VPCALGPPPPLAPPQPAPLLRQRPRSAVAVLRSLIATHQEDLATRRAALADIQTICRRGDIAGDDPACQLED
jgi:hypothetical protein